jgi:hypothetical protein
MLFLAPHCSFYSRCFNLSCATCPIGQARKGLDSGALTEWWLTGYCNQSGLFQQRYEGLFLLVTQLCQGTNFPGAAACSWKQNAIGAVIWYHIQLRREDRTAPRLAVVEHVYSGKILISARISNGKVHVPSSWWLLGAERVMKSLFSTEVHKFLQCTLKAQINKCVIQ